MSEVDLLSILANQDNKLMNEQSLQMSRPYRQRKFTSHGIQQLGQFRLKLYTICASNQETPDLNEVLSHIQQILPSYQLEQQPLLDLGYVIIHAGEDSIWVLTRLWTEGDIILTLLSANKGQGYQKMSEPLMECIWEEVIIFHERNAWIRQMLGGQPNAEAYLNAVLIDGFY